MLMVFLLFVGCSRHDDAKKDVGCEDALRSASKKVLELQDAKQLAETVSTCIRDSWPLDTRQCVATVRDKPDFVACMMRFEDNAKPTTAHKLTVTAIEPEKGDAAGGTYVRIKGTDFIAEGARNAKVYFGSRQGTVVRFASDSELIIEAPGGKPDETVDVLLIFEPGGEIKLPHAFAFVQK